MKTITINCRECGKTFSITPEEQENFKNKGLQLPTHCPKCREKRRNIIVKTCKECRKEFRLNQLDEEWFIKKFGNSPERCEPCRKRRREEREEAASK